MFKGRIEERVAQFHALAARVNERDRLRAELSNSTDAETVAQQSRLVAERTRAADALRFERSQLGGSAGWQCKLQAARAEVQRLDAMPPNDPQRGTGAVRE